jgi:hypothetical protein
MKQMLKRVLAAVCKLGKQGPVTRVERRFRPQVEGMEQRLVPATSVGGAALPLGAPALVGTGAEHEPGSIVLPERPVHGYKWRPHWPRIVSAAETGGGHGVADPEQPVHGYKWRRRWPVAAAAESTGVATKADGATYFIKIDGLAGEHVPTPTKEMVVGSHLAVGGSDGLTVLVIGGGQVVTHGPHKG